MFPVAAFPAAAFAPASFPPAGAVIVIEKIGGPRDWGRIDGQRAREDEEIIMFIVTWTEMQS